MQIGKEELSLFVDHKTLYLKDLKGFIRRLLDLINIFSNAAGYKISKKAIRIFSMYR
jgi:hypothetical protein